ncbi:MAG: DUF167 domain-containing protein [Zoogloeaceae bacterium]|nr:DUF167 domain-containing protein [Zoogloeaceae bacterium]
MSPGDWWLRREPSGDVVVSLYVQPGAKRTEFAGRHGESLKLRLAAPPVEGRANAALCAFLAEFCDVPKSAVALVSGDTARAKRVRIVGAGEAALARLAALVT